MVEVRDAGVLDHIRFVLSSLLLAFSMVVTSYAIVEQHTHFWRAVPGWAALLLFILDLFILGIVEGLQIALVELKRQHPDSYKRSHPAAYKLGRLAAKGDNVERFLMGRQVCVVVLVFFAAKLTTIQLDEDRDFLFPVPVWVEKAFLETGLLACVVVVIIAQLMPQICAAKYPVHFLEFIIMKPAYYGCIALEVTGLTHACWLLSCLLSIATGMRSGASEVKSVEDIIQAVDASLDHVGKDGDGDSQSSSSSSSDGDTGSDYKKSLLHQDHHHHQHHSGDKASTQFTKLVDNINQSITPDTLRVLRNYLDRHPEKFAQFPSVVGNKVYPAPHQLAVQMREDGHQVPKFLTDISDADHVPPHIVACEMLAQNRQLQEEVDLLRRKMAATDDGR